MKPSLPENEADRLKALYELDILDSEAEESFDDLTRLAGYICEAPIAAITFIDSERQWFKSPSDFPVSETPRNISFCAHAILQSEPFIVPNALDDERFKDNPFVTSEHNIRFYAGAPLTTEQGFELGTLCVMDTEPRTLTTGQIAALKVLRNQVINLIKSRQERIFMNRERSEDRKKIQELEEKLSKVRQLVN
jgi:GAF domain-containing protein